MSSMKAILRRHGIFYLRSDGRSLMNLISALKGQPCDKVEVGVYEADQDPALADEMKRKFQAIKEKITRSRNH